MGIVKDALGQALGANDIKNGFNGPRLPFGKGDQRAGNASSIRMPSPVHSKNSYQSSGSSIDSRQQNSLASQHLYQNRRRHYPRSATNCSCDTQQQLAPTVPGSSNCGQQSQTSIPLDRYDRRHTNESPPPSYDQSADHELGLSTKASHYANMQSDRNKQPVPSIYHGKQEDYDNWDVTQYHSSSRPFNDRSMDRSSFRPIALPQTAIGEGEPFLRGYSKDLRCYGITDGELIEIIDAINVAIVPNPEQVIFQKGANIAGWFLPGAASLGLMAGQFGVGIGAAFGHASLVNRVLSKANLEVFVPKGLEICIAKTQHLEAEIGQTSFLDFDSGLSPEEWLSAYGDLVAPVTHALPRLERIGRNDPVAMLGRGIGHRDQQRKVSRAQKDLRKGKSGKQDGIDSSLKWLMVRCATPDAIEHWQKALQQSEADMRNYSFVAQE